MSKELGNLDVIFEALSNESRGEWSSQAPIFTTYVTDEATQHTMINNQNYYN